MGRAARAAGGGPGRGGRDRAALETLAARHGRSLRAEGVAVVPIGGAMSAARYLDRYGPHGLDLRLAGLCDAGEEPWYRRGLEHAGLGTGLSREGMEALGFYTCVADLEDELIRALGTTAVERVVAAEGELPSLRRFQKQPAQRGRDVDRQLHRFLGTRAGRKIRYAGLLVRALDLDRAPRPLRGPLAAL